MKRTSLAIATIFALIPLSASADRLPKQEVGQPIPKLQPVKPIEPPKIEEAAPIEEIPAPAPEPAPAASIAPTVQASVGYCGDNQYKQFIYSHESGCNTDRWNSSGCYGIGQACPASKIAYCGADFACQDAWFTDYASRAYGGWEGAYNFWVSHGWW